MTQPLLLRGDSLKVQLIWALWAWRGGRTQLPQPQNTSWMRNILFLGQPCSSAKAQPLLRKQSRQGTWQPSGALWRSKMEPLFPVPMAGAPGEACRSSAGLRGPSPSSSTPGGEQREKQYRAHRGFGDRRSGVISARTYFYADEAKCDQHMETFLRCIDASSKCSTCPEQPRCAWGLQGPCSPLPYLGYVPSACPASSVSVALSRWQLQGRLLSHQADSAGQTSVPGECQGCDQGEVGQSQGHRGCIWGEAGALGFQACCSGISSDGREEWAPTGCPLCARDHPGDPASTFGDM